jgi:hypothetical protein
MHFATRVRTWRVARVYSVQYTLQWYDSISETFRKRSHGYIHFFVSDDRYYDLFSWDILYILTFAHVCSGSGCGEREGEPDNVGESSPAPESSSSSTTGSSSMKCCVTNNTDFKFMYSQTKRWLDVEWCDKIGYCEERKQIQSVPHESNIQICVVWLKSNNILLRETELPYFLCTSQNLLIF